MVDLSTPQGQAAQQFMRHKGYDVDPSHVEQLEGQNCWYFYYHLPEGVLELEVFWDGAEWLTTVTLFTLAM